MKLMVLSAVVVKSYPLVTVPLFLYFFTKEEFGALDYAYYVMSLGCILLTFGVNNGYARYALDSTIQIDLKVKKFSYYLLSSILITVIALAVLLFILFSDLGVREWIPAVLHENFIAFVLYIVSGALAHTVLTAERFSLNAKALIVTTFVIYVLPLLAVIIGYLALGKISIGLILNYHTFFNSFAFTVGFYRSFCKVEVIHVITFCRRCVIYSAPLLIVLVSESLINFSGRLFLTRLYPEGLGDFAIASRISSVLLILNFFISFMFSPIYFRDRNKVCFFSFWTSLYSSFVSVYCLALIFAAGFISLFAPYFSDLSDSRVAVSILIILGANLLAGLQMFHLGMHVKEHTFVVGLIYIIAIPVTFGLNLILINQFQLIGTGLALLITMAFITVPYIYYSNRFSEKKLLLNFHAKLNIALALSSALFFAYGNGDANFYYIESSAFIALCICIITIKKTIRYYHEVYQKA